MNQGINHPLATGAVAVGVTDVLPTVQWALSGFHGPVPVSTSALIAGGIVVAIHAGINWFTARAAARSMATPAGTQS